MKKYWQLVLGCSIGFSCTAYAQANEPVGKETFLQCMAIAYDQEELDPDAEMKNHWREYGNIYGANVYFYSRSIQYIADNLGEQIGKWPNMREVLGAEKVNGLALMLLKKCDAEATDHPERQEPYAQAFKSWNEARKK